MAGDLNFIVNADTSSAIKNLQNLNNALSSVGNAFKVVIAAAGITSLTKFGDEVTSLRNKLAILSGSQEIAGKTFNAIAAIAISARSDLAATGDLYFRIARAADQLGISSQEAGQITESVAKALTASGLSAQEASGPLLQLGQALQSGRFQGDELRSILEGLPPVAKALADQLGVPVGALKDLGSQGRITGKDFVEAMRNARDAIEQDFARTIPTISQAFNELRAAVSLAFKNFEESTGAGQSFAQAIQYIGFVIFKLSKDIDSIIGPIMTFIKIVGAIAAFTIVGRILAGVGAAIGGLASGFMALSRGISIAKDFILNFGGVINAVGKNTTGFITVLGAIIKPFAQIFKIVSAAGAAIATFFGIDKLIEKFNDLKDPTSEASNDMAEYRAELEKMKKAMDDSAKAAPPTYIDPEKLKKATAETQKIVLNYQRQNQELMARLGLEQSLIGLSDQEITVRQALFDLEQGYYKEINRLLDEYRDKSTSAKDEDKAALPVIQQALIDISNSYADHIDKVKTLVSENYRLNELEKQRQQLIEFSNKMSQDGARKLREIQDDIAKSTMTELEKRYYDIARAADESARSAIESENARRRSLKLTQMSADEEKKYYDESKKKVAELQAAEKTRYEQNRSFSTGWRNAFNQYIEDATNAAEAARRVFENATKGMEDLIVNFVKTGKFEFKNFVASLAEELLRSQVRQLMANLLNLKVGNSGSTNSSLLGNLFAGFFADGGFIPPGKFGIVGERGPELISGPTQVTPATSQQVVNYNISAVDAMSFKQMIARDPSFIHAVAMQGGRGIPGRYA